MSKLGPRKLRDSVLDLAECLDPQEVAQRTGVDVQRVRSILSGVERHRVPCVVINSKTKAATQHSSFRAAYLHICIKGLTDWTWHTAADYAEWRRVNGL